MVNIMEEKKLLDVMLDIKGLLQEIVETIHKDPGEYLTTKDAAKLLKKNEKTIRNWCNQGKLRSVKLGKGGKSDRHYITRESIDVLLRGWRYKEKWRQKENRGGL